ncbi:MAG: sterol desaturase family protein [Gammaproteobacteria bacterium]|nr:sterol desaturase family protein [Gammaproteobacteria bacterium]
MSDFVIVVLALNFLIAATFTGIELYMPTHKLEYRKIIWKDFSSTVVVIFMGLIVAVILTSIHLHFKRYFPSLNWVHHRPFYIQFLLYVLVVDFGLYWVHRLMHQQHWWRFHRWHHYPTYMYWGAGLRASIVHQFLFNIVAILAVLIIQEDRPLWFAIFATTHFQIPNNFMHMNVIWKSEKLEWLIVTPRYHHLHHSSNIRLHNGNYAAFFSFWDRLFGTYIDPGKVYHYEYGTGEKKTHPLMFLGF